MKKERQGWESFFEATTNSEPNSAAFGRRVNAAGDERGGCILNEKAVLINPTHPHPLYLVMAG